jgi:hypothetical protein
MKLNKHEQAKPNVAGLTSQVQQAEMKVILAGRWPPLKPLPVFKYGTDEYRAEIHFDSTRGEWVCRKTSFPSNKVQDLRGGLIEMTMALPHGQPEVFTEAVAAEQQEQELENEAHRRHQAMLEWREKFENGARYSKLQNYLSESQQDEIHDSIRMTLTARQLQFNPKNVEFIFVALWKAGGRLATIIEVAQRKKAEQEADTQAQAESDALEAERQVPVETIHPTPDRRLHMRTAPASLAYVMFGDTNGGIVLNISETGMAVAVADLVVVGDYLRRIRIQLPSSRQDIEISAQIVWLAESKKGAGLRFVDLTADARNQISNWIASEKSAPEFEQLPELLRDDQSLEISSRKSRRTFGNPPVSGGEAAARYGEMFPSESICTTHTIPADEIKLQRGPVQFPATTPTDSGVTMSGSAAEISIGDVPQSQEATFTPEHVKNILPEPIKTFVPELSEDLKPESAESVLPTTLENFPTEPIGSLSLDEVQSSSAELIASASTRASHFVAREILGASPVSLVAGPQKKKQYHTAGSSFGSQVRADKVESSTDRIGDSPSQLFASEISAKKGFGFRVGALVFLVIGFTVGFTVGLNTPAVPPEAEESRSGSQSAQSADARPADSATLVRPTGPSSAVTSRSHIDSDNSSAASTLDHTALSEEKTKEGTRDAESFAKVPSTDSNSSPTIESKPSAKPESSPGRIASTGLIARNAPPPASPKPANSPKAVSRISDAPRRPAPRRVTSATGAAPHPSPPSAILVSAPTKGNKSFRLTFPEKPIAASSSFAMSSQLSVLDPPESGPAAAHKPARVQAGELVSYVWPRYSRPGNRHGSSETVKVRATIGQLGQVLDIKFVNGSLSLLPATMSAIRRWRYKPTLLNGRPVQAQQDVTIEFRPPQYLSRVSAHRASLN